MRASALAACIAVASLARAEPVAPALTVQTVPLANGLRVVLAPDPSVQDVLVHVRYEPGAASELGDQGGYTLLVEKLFALGTVHTKAGDHARHIADAGGWTTSTTTLDDLTLVTQVPAGALERVLWLEAERMAGLADGITQQGIDEARAAIAAEYRAAYVEQPHALVDREIARLFGDHDVLGNPTVLGRATIDSVRAFIRDRIQPGRATLVIVGNFDVTRTRQLARRYFGWIPGQRRSQRITYVAPPKTHVATTIVDAVPRVVVAHRLRGAAGDVLLTARQLESYLRRFFAKRATEVIVEVREHVPWTELQIRVTPSPGAELVSLAHDIEDITDGSWFAIEDKRVRRVVTVERLQMIESLGGRARLLATSTSANLTVPLGQSAARLDDAERVTVIAEPAR